MREHLKYRDVPDTAPVIITKDAAYFTLYNLSGKIVGYQRYNPKGRKARGIYRDAPKEELKYVTTVTRENPERNIPYLAVYGLHTLKDHLPYVFVVEGIFDAVKLEKLGYPVIATLTNDPVRLSNFLSMLPKVKIVWRDRDEPSKRLNKVADFSLCTPAPYKDLGDMLLEDVKAWSEYILWLIWMQRTPAWIG
ncbi:MAG: hypothetical protein AMJ42_04520 [Deltaproteobacteria bacterium DG_8]|nr:MAG: hypothetical protein AMJ42_04520 [Deltaproteobacteria bacterium DG_8]